jgi:hypothetical protein
LQAAAFCELLCKSRSLGEYAVLAAGADSRAALAEMFAANQQKTTKLWMWRMEYLHHEQRPLYFGEWF